MIRIFFYLSPYFPLDFTTNLSLLDLALLNNGSNSRF